MNFDIVPIDISNADILEHFLFEAIYIPEGVTPPPLDIVHSPELEIYYRDFGSLKDDIGFAAVVAGKAVGAAWARVINSYGHIDDNTPSVAISVDKEYRGKGIGKELLSRLLSHLDNLGYKQTSLSVQKENYAVRMYMDLGYTVEDENDQEYIMVRESSRKDKYCEF